MSPSYRFAPVKFVIPFAQLEIGEVFAAGAHGQVRKGSFAGKAVAIKQLLSVMFNPEQTEAFKVCIALLHFIKTQRLLFLSSFFFNTLVRNGYCNRGHDHESIFSADLFDAAFLCSTFRLNSLRLTCYQPHIRILYPSNLQ